METIAEAKQELRDNWEKGIECKCCGQFVKKYDRKINSAMAYVLILMYNRPHQNKDDGWVHVENYLKTLDTPASLRGDFPKLRHWNLIEQMDGEREDGSSRVGIYRITEKGKSFTRGEITVPQFAMLYNQKFLGLKGDSVNINDALGTKFNYSELMNG